MVTREHGHKRIEQDNMSVFGRLSFSCDETLPASSNFCQSECQLSLSMDAAQTCCCKPALTTSRQRQRQSNYDIVTAGAPPVAEQTLLPTQSLVTLTADGDSDTTDRGRDSYTQHGHDFPSVGFNFEPTTSRV